MLVEISSKNRAKAEAIIDQLGEPEFRRRLATMTQWTIDKMSLDEVTTLFVLARQGRVHPPDRSRNVAELSKTLPPRAADDAGYSDAVGKQITRTEWLRQRAERIRTEHFVS